MRQKVNLPTLAETALLPLYGRYCWHRNEAINFEDPFAKRVVDTIDYDFSPVEKKIGEYGLAVWGNRSFKLDQLSKAELENGFVVNLGVGSMIPSKNLDREGRVIDVDFPEILEFRDKLIEPDNARQIFRESFSRLQMGRPNKGSRL